MKRVKLTTSLLLLATVAFATGSFATETIDWRALAPPVDYSLDPLQGLSPDLQDSLYDLWMIRERKADGSIANELEEIENEAIVALENADIDIEKTLQELIAFNKLLEANDLKLVEELNGKEVRIPGYMLPTEFSSTRIVEFLLVPYVGACVHTPPPPLNQMVHVSTDTDIEVDGLFTPVWVTGRISTEAITQEVEFNDGVSELEVGYSIVAVEIQPFEE